MIALFLDSPAPSFLSFFINLILLSKFNIFLKKKEIDRVNTHLKKNFEELEKFVDEASLSSSDTWYRIMFFAKQRAIHVLSYANYKINDQLSTEEVTGNFVEFTNKQFPELKKSETDKLLH